MCLPIGSGRLPNSFILCKCRTTYLLLFIVYFCESHPNLLRTKKLCCFLVSSTCNFIFPRLWICICLMILFHLFIILFAMQNMYRKAAEFWAELRLELLSANEFFAEEKGNSNQIWRLYWASHQVLLPYTFKIAFKQFYCLCIHHP